jgi:riboflavin kinase/FMN adenylyltransferase
MPHLLVKGLDDLPQAAHGCVLSIGNFDGVHRGHQAILRIARRLADERKTHLLCVTFDPPPAALVNPANVPQAITPLAEKCRLLRQHGADFCGVVQTSVEFLSIEADDFVRQVYEKLRYVATVEGPDFCFGKNRAGNVELLRRLGATTGFDVVEVPPEMVELSGLGKVRVSSSLIRRLIGQGDVVQAATCLGRNFVLYGEVVKGEQRGRQLNFPTANVDPGNIVVPGDGVYAGRALIAGQSFASAISIGTKPTFGTMARCIEAHLIDGVGELYHQPIELTFLQRLRAQQKFGGVEELTAQIAKDVQRAREIAGRS